MSNLDQLLERNLAFSHTGAHDGLPPIPRHQLFIVTCMDARIDPAHILGLEVGDALVFRNGGGRITPDVIRDIAFVAAAVTMMSSGEPPSFEVAVIHHTRCGSAFLADEDFSASLAAATGSDATELAALAVTDPHQSIAADIETLLRSGSVPDTVTTSGHVYDVDTGLITTIHPAVVKADATLGAER